MFGYVGTIESELKVREAASYRSWYCGLCQCMKRRYGPLSSLFLQYDCAFLALLFSGELGETVDAKRCHCLHRCHDPRRKYRLETPALRFAAAVNVLLAYYKCLDDWRDEKALIKGAAALLLKGAVRRAGRDYPALRARTEQFYRDQAAFLCRRQNRLLMRPPQLMTRQLMRLLLLKKQPLLKKMQQLKDPMRRHLKLKSRRKSIRRLRDIFLNRFTPGLITIRAIDLRKALSTPVPDFTVISSQVMTLRFISSLRIISVR